MGKFYIKPSDESENGIVKLEYDKNNIIHLDDIPDIDFDMKMTSVNEKYYKYVTKMCRHTPEYRDFIQFMKHNLNVDHCSFYEGYSIKNGFTIELHHAPFTLYDYVEACCTKSMSKNGWVETFKICEEVISLHYKFMVGLTPLNPTAHKLVHSDVLPVHPKIIIGDWKGFYGEYSAWLSEAAIKKYEDAIAMEKKTDIPGVPEILEYAPTILKTNLPKLTEKDLDKMVIENKIKMLEANQQKLQEDKDGV